jgi:mycothiol synthase
MVTSQLINENILVPGSPSIPGLVFRSFHGDPDLPLMLEVINSCKVEDGIERSDTLLEITNNYHHLERCDPHRDMLMAEVDGRLIAYTRVFWNQQEDGIFTYATFGFLLPEWRHKGLGTAMLNWTENRLRQVAAEQGHSGTRYFQTELDHTQKSANALIMKAGYQPARYEFMMKRSVNDPLPDAPMPQGLEVRPFREEQLHAIWAAMVEAFKDHWGSVPESEERFLSWKDEATYRPELWKVAWEGDQVAGMVLNFYNQAENEEYKRLRGYTEGISVRRPWRKKGLARSLIVQSIRMFKEMGMTETCLGVDSQNLSGALRLYESVGYRQFKQLIIYRKAMD